MQILLRLPSDSRAVPRDMNKMRSVSAIILKDELNSYKLHNILWWCGEPLFSKIAVKMYRPKSIMGKKISVALTCFVFLFFLNRKKEGDDLRTCLLSKSIQCLFRSRRSCVLWIGPRTGPAVPVMDWCLNLPADQHKYFHITDKRRYNKHRCRW